MAEPLARAKPKPKATAVRTPQPVAAEHSSASGGIDHGESSGGTSALAAIHALGAQPAMRLDRVDDPWEREAERVADHVTDGPAGVAPPIISRLQPGALRPISRLARDDAEPLEDAGVDDDDGGHGMPIQRACCEGCAHGGPCAGKPHDERERETGMPVQRESLIEKYESIIRLQQDCEALDARGPGTPLPAPTLRTLEPRMGIALGGVRVHEGSDAAEKARGLGARAFTQGRDIFLGSGESPDDTSLMAHEVAHVVQQGAIPRAAPSTPDEARPGSTAGGEPGGGPPMPAAALGPVGPPYIPKHRVAPPPDVTTHMPAPPEAPSRTTRRKLSRVTGAMAHNAKAQAKVPPGHDQLADAHETVDQPPNEAQADANSVRTEQLIDRALPDARIEALCDRIRLIIRCKRPPDEDSLVDAEPEKMARQAGDALQDDVKGAVDNSSNVYGIEDFDAKAKAPAEGAELTPQPDAERVPLPSAAQAVPEAVAPDHVSLDADVGDTDARMREAGMDTPSARLVQDGPIADARGSRDELARMAVQDTAKVIAAEDEARTAAAADMVAFQRDTAAALVSARTRNVTTVVKQQGDAKLTEEEKRSLASEQANKAYAAAQSFVTETLTKLPGIAMAKWDAGVNGLTGDFKRTLAKTRKSIDERHSGVLGSTVVAVWDWGTGLPDWVTETYDKAEKEFGDGICKLAADVSSDVNTAVQKCHDRITLAQQEIHTAFATLGGELVGWAATEEARFNKQLAGLHKQADAARRDFTQQLVDRAGQAVQDVREQIYALRQEAMGLIGRIADHINRFLSDPIRYIVNGLLRLLGIAPAAFWRVVERVREVIDEIVDDPLPFANNLASAVGRGFDLFFQHLPRHLVQGFLKWLFGSVEGLEVPRDFSLRSVLTFFLQLMGITWQRVRAILAKHLGERNVALVERAWGLFATFIKRGWDGLVDLVKGALDPMQLIGKVIDAAVAYVSQQIVERAAARLAVMFVPGGAILQAIEIIYRILKWIFQNAAKIWTLIETIVGGLRDILSGAIEGLAKRIETALANLIPAVIGFIAGFFGLDDLPKKVSETVQGMRTWVEGLMERAVVAVVNAGRRLLERAGLRQKEDGKPPKRDGEVGETETFVAGGAAHRLWVSVRGTRPVIMAASEPEPLLVKLDRWDASLGTPTSQLGPTETTEARGLIPQVRQHVNTATTQATSAVASDAAAKAPNATPEQAAAAAEADDKTEAAEREVVPGLRRLFELFGELTAEQRRLAFLPLIAQAAPRWARSRADDVHGWWARDEFPRATFGAPPRRVFTASVLAGTERAAIALGATPAIHDDFYRGYAAAQPGLYPNARHVTESRAFGEWAFRSTDAALAHRADFLQLLGDAAAAQMRSEAANTIAASNLPSADKTSLADAFRKELRWESNTNVGRFVFPTDEEGEHSRFRPVGDVKVIPQNGQGIAEYDTVSGQHFRVVVTDGRFPVSIHGTRLQMMTGRGYTGAAPGQTANLGLNAAHVIANEFGGSGYQKALNLVTTSWEYNQQSMRDAERAVGRTIERFAQRYAPDEPAITFEVTVNVQWGEVLDSTILAEIRKEPWYPRDPTHDLEKSIRDAIAAGLVGHELRRVMGITYTWMIHGPGGRSQGPHTYNLGPDRWILAGTLGPGQEALWT